MEIIFGTAKKLQKNDKEYKNVILGRPYICPVNYKNTQWKKWN